MQIVNFCKGKTLKGLNCRNKIQNGQYCSKHKPVDSITKNHHLVTKKRTQFRESETNVIDLASKQFVYMLRCNRYYGQLEGLFLTLPEIEIYLQKHDKQPSPPDNMFSKSEFWEYEDLNDEYYSNYYFTVRRIEYISKNGRLTESKTWLSKNDGYYVLYQDGGAALLASDNETELKRAGLKKVFEKCKGYHHYNKECKNVYTETTVEWLIKMLKADNSPTIKEIPFIIDHLSSKQVDKVWHKRIKGDSWSTKYYILELYD